MKKHIAALAALTLAVSVGASIAAAAGSRAGTPAPPQSAVMQRAGDTGDSTDITGAGDTADTSDGDAAATHRMNHGFFVSKAAHTCAHGSHAVHGNCVRVVAQSSMGKPAEGSH